MPKKTVNDFKQAALTDTRRTPAARPAFTRTSSLPARDLLTDLAPVLVDGDKAAMAAFLRTVLDTPNEKVIAIQAGDLDPVWAAFERADRDIVQVDKNGRADIPFTREKLHQLFVDTGAHFNTVQTQLPVIMTDTLNFQNEAATVHKSLRKKQQPLAIDIPAINGSHVDILKSPYEAGARFAFIMMKRDGTRVPKASPKEKEKHQLVVPALMIDSDTLKKTIAHGGIRILRDLQQMLGIVNHDYFHYFTARITGIYVGRDNFFNTTMMLDSTPYGRLMNTAMQFSHGMTSTNKPGPEHSTSFYRDRYYSDERWKGFSLTKNAYEFHALHMQGALYRDYLHDGPVGEKFMAHMHSYFDGLKQAAAAIDAKCPGMGDRVMMYYSILLYTNLLRIVPYTHPLATLCESRIDGLGISKDYIKQCLFSEDQDLAEYKKHLEESHNLTLQSVRTTGEAVRFLSYKTTINDLETLHQEKYSQARNFALPALRQYISCLIRDMALAKWRGGRPAWEAMFLQPETPGMPEPS